MRDRRVALAFLALASLLLLAANLAQPADDQGARLFSMALIWVVVAVSALALGMGLLTAARWRRR